MTSYIRNILIFGIVNCLAVLSATASYASSNWLIIEVEIDVKDHVQVRVLNWLNSNKKYRKIDPDQGPNSKGDRVYRIEILDGAGKVMDSIVAKLISSPILIFPHLKGSKGKIPSRVKVVFPADVGMNRIKIFREDKDIFEAKLLDVSADLEIEMLERQNYFGISQIRNAIRGVDRGASEALFRRLLSGSDECIAKKSELISDCEKIKLRAERNLKFAK